MAIPWLEMFATAGEWDDARNAADAALKACRGRPLHEELAPGITVRDVVDLARLVNAFETAIAGAGRVARFRHVTDAIRDGVIAQITNPQRDS